LNGYCSIRLCSKDEVARQAFNVTVKRKTDNLGFLIYDRAAGITADNIACANKIQRR